MHVVGEVEGVRSGRPGGCVEGAQVEGTRVEGGAGEKVSCGR